MGKLASLLAGDTGRRHILVCCLVFVALVTPVVHKADVHAGELQKVPHGYNKPFTRSGQKHNDAMQRPQGRRASPPGVSVLSDLEYAVVNGTSLKLDLYLPKNSTAAPPLIVWIHGGGWVNGDKSMVNRAVIALSAEGYAVASVNYRLTGMDSHPQQIHDVKGAVRWLRANAGTYGYDASRIGAGGGSAGAHLALLLGLSANEKTLEGDIGGNLDQSSSVQAVIDLFGPSDLELFAESSKRFRQKRSQNREVWKLASPLNYLSADDPPVLIMHGDTDPVVPLSLSILLHERYQQAGLESELHVIEGAGHGGMVFSDSTRKQMMKEFFDRYIKNVDNVHESKIVRGTTSAVVVKSANETKDKAGISSSETKALHGFHWMIGPRAGLRGSNDKFDRLLKNVDQTLSTNPVINGVYIIQHWNLIEPMEGQYEFERLDRLIGLIRRHGRYYKLAIAPGIYTPEWLYEKGAQAFETKGSNPARVNIYNKPVKIPVPWDPVYLTSYRAILEKVAERYRKDPSFRAVTMTAATFMSPEWHLPHSAEDRRHWREMGDFTVKLAKVWQDGIDQFAKLFPRQILVLEASSYPVGEQALGDSIVGYGARSYPGRFAVQINQLTGRFDQLNRPTYAKLLAYRERYGDDIIIGLQNIKGWSFPKIREQQGSMEMTAYNFMQADGDYWELWYGDGKNAKTGKTLRSLLAKGREIGLEEFRQQLTAEGKYQVDTMRRYR